jgi:hypothetical protein
MTLTDITELAIIAAIIAYLIEKIVVAIRQNPGKPIPDTIATSLTTGLQNVDNNAVAIEAIKQLGQSVPPDVFKAILAVLTAGEGATKDAAIKAVLAELAKVTVDVTTSTSGSSVIPPTTGQA